VPNRHLAFPARQAESARIHLRVYVRRKGAAAAPAGACEAASYDGSTGTIVGTISQICLSQSAFPNDPANCLKKGKPKPFLRR
jgi:hypothetical protein